VELAYFRVLGVPDSASGVWIACFWVYMAHVQAKIYSGF